MTTRTPLVVATRAPSPPREGGPTSVEVTRAVALARVVAECSAPAGHDGCPGRPSRSGTRRATTVVAETEPADATEEVSA